MRRRVRSSPPDRRMAAFDPARDGADAIRLKELERSVTMAWFDAQPPESRAAQRVGAAATRPPQSFIAAELARAGVGVGFDGGLILPPLAA